jgi:predicted small metal-binding protein
MAALRAGPSIALLVENAMKTMKCKELGGQCDQQLSAGSWGEMVKVMTKHVLDKHPDVARQMERMHDEDPKRWGKEMKPNWEAAPEASAHR